LLPPVCDVPPVTTGLVPLLVPTELEPQPHKISA
jgi:hypothetical protein